MFNAFKNNPMSSANGMFQCLMLLKIIQCYFNCDVDIKFKTIATINQIKFENIFEKHIKQGNIKPIKNGIKQVRYNLHTCIQGLP
jgi:hypothetical protein